MSTDAAPRVVVIGESLVDIVHRAAGRSMRRRAAAPRTSP